ncbi:MAG: hypothetical protein FWD88_07650 [Treponema sp.]|nr:hypothetical protein [Treponema sp.]
MKHVFVIDPDVFSNQQWKMDGLQDAIGQYFRTQEKPDFTIVVSKFPREALGVIQKQVDESGGDTVRVYAVGGDGIMFDCLNAIMGLPNTELAVMPYGVANTFIRSFGDGNAEPFNSVTSVADAPTIPTDAIEVGNTYAITGCAVGFTPAVVIKTRALDDTKLARGLDRFAANIRRFFTSLSFVFDKNITARRYNIIIDNQDYSGTYSMVSIVNGPYFGRKKLPLERTALNDGYLDVILFRSAAVLATLFSLRRYAKGKMPSNCVRVRAKKVEMHSDKPMWIQTDGEYLMDTSMTFEVLPEAVQIVAVDNLTYQEC